jgi:Tol biopolymer transport system component
MKASRFTSSILLGMFLATGIGMAMRPAQAAFPGENGKIVFTIGAYGDIYTMNPDGTGQTRLTTNAVIGEVPSVWSPDGKMIVFARYTNNTQHIWVMNADGSGQRKLTSSDIYETEPSWTPNGKIIFRRTNSTGRTDVYSINPDGTGETRLDNLKGDGKRINFAWSPDGTKITFVRINSQHRSSLWVMNVDGSGAQQLTPGETEADSVPQWSPDSKKIVFKRYWGNNRGLYTINANGTGLTRLTNNSGLELTPRWSPDGTKIVFTRNSQIFTMNPDGSNQQEIKNPGVGQDSSVYQESVPDWQPLP